MLSTRIWSNKLKRLFLGEKNQRKKEKWTTRWALEKDVLRAKIVQNFSRSIFALHPRFFWGVLYDLRVAASELGAATCGA